MKLAKYQPCGCVVCTCEDPEGCHGCGAKNCGTHPVGEMPNPVYEAPSAFDVWWREEGSALAPLPDEDQEQHARRIAEIAWKNGEYVGGEEMREICVAMRKKDKSIPTAGEVRDRIASLNTKLAEARETLRDRFAMAAMNAIIVASGANPSAAEEMGVEAAKANLSGESYLAISAYEMADAMLAGRTKPKANGLS